MPETIEGQEPKTTMQTGQEPDTGAGQEPDADEGQLSLDALKSLRKEAKGLRDRMKAQAIEIERLKVIEAEREAKEIGELAALKKQHEALKSSLDAAQARALDAEVTTAASAKGMRSPHLAPRLIDRTQVELDADGRPTNLEKLIEGLLKASPELKGGAVAAGGNPKGDAGSADDKARRDAAVNSFSFLRQRVQATEKK